MGLFKSDYNDTSSGYWSYDDCVEGPDFYKEEKKKKVKKVERSRHEEDDEDDGEEYDWDGAGQVLAWLMGIGLFVNFWWIILPVGLVCWLVGKDS